MDEVDEIIVVTLKELGCVPDHVESARDLDSDSLYAAVLHCVQIIQADQGTVDQGGDGKQLPRTLPKSMAVRVNTVTKLVKQVREAGFRLDLSYHMFLYPNLETTRKLLSWLIEALPTRELADNDQGQGGWVDQVVGLALRPVAATPWSPWFCRVSTRSQAAYPRSVHTGHVASAPADDTALDPAQRRFLESAAARPSACQPRSCLAAGATVLDHEAGAVARSEAWDAEWAAKGIGSGLSQDEYRRRKRAAQLRALRGHVRTAYVESGGGDRLKRMLDAYQRSHADSSKFARQAEFDVEGDVDMDRLAAESEEDLVRRRQDELADLEAQLAKLHQARDRMVQQMDEFASTMQQLQTRAAAEDELHGRLTDEYHVKKRTYDLLPDADNNIAKLKQLSKDMAGTILSLADEWEQHRVPLVNKLRQLIAEHASLKDRNAERLESIRKRREEMKKMGIVAAQKDERYKQLLESLRGLKKEGRRGNYTRRILDTVRQTKKLKVDIANVLEDIRALQKQINQEEGRLQRTFTVASDLLFNDAKKVEAARDGYRKLASMNEQFKALGVTVEETGASANQSLLLEEKIRTLEQRAASFDVVQLKADLANVVADNQAAQGRLQKLKLGVEQDILEVEPDSKDTPLSSAKEESFTSPL